VDVSALAGASGAGGGVDGRIESVQDGKALVKLLGGSTVQVPVDRELPTGTPVTVATASDGTLQLTVRTPDADLAKLRETILNALQSLLGEPLASALSTPLARGDFAAAARSLPSAPPPGTAISGPVESTLSGPVFLSDPSSPRPPVGTALIAVLSSLGGNAYSAEVAGQPRTLFGPSGVEPSTRLLARAQILPGGGAVWTPDPAANSSQSRGLPERVQAGPAGALELLQWAGAPEASQAEIEDLGKALAAAAKSLFEQAQTGAGGVSAEADPPGVAANIPGAPASEPSPAAVPVAPLAPTPGRVEQIPSQAAAREAVAPNAAGQAGDPETVFAKTAVPANDPGTAVPAPAATAPSPTAEPSVPGHQTAGPVGNPQSETTTQSPAQIPSNIAVKVLAAWSLDLPPTETVRRASLGQTPLDLPAALDSLEKLVQESPGKHPGLEAALQGLREQGKVPSGNLAEGPRRTLEAAVLDALAKESAEGGDPKPLRQAAESLLADRLPDPAPGAESGQAYWASGPAGWEKARIVVRDERERKGGKSSQTEFHAVDVAMDPSGLGRIDARLELRGNVLTTRLRAADPATVDLLRKGLPELSAAFARIGLESGPLEVRGDVPVHKALPRRPGAGGALDVRA
jgi:hypothetical protein